MDKIASQNPDSVTLGKELEIRKYSVSPINSRIKKLREQSLSKQPTISSQRAKLITEFYKSNEARGKSAPVKRALAFKYLVKNKDIPLQEGELIVGEKGIGPKDTPTYPEICAHSQEDLEILNSRDKTPYQVDDETRKLYKDEIIPFWKGRSIRDQIFAQMSKEWKQAYEAGVFTEFMEQRAPGHTVLGNKIYEKGLLDIKRDIQVSKERLDPSDPEYHKKKQELKAMDIAADALITYAERYAEKLEKKEQEEDDQKIKEELKQMAKICRRVPAHPPRTFWEALQYYWFVHIGVITELNPWDSFCPGRLDQHLYPFYLKDIKEGRLDKNRAKELLEAFWIKFNNQPAPPKVGVTAEESNTYSDFSLINLGGVKEDGSDGVNELTYLILEVTQEMRLVQPSLMVQISQRNPNRFLERALQIVRTGFGQPSIFNTDGIIVQLLRQGKSIADARGGGSSGCVTIGAFGKESYILTGYFNLPKVLEITLNNGVDPCTGKKIGIETGNPIEFRDFDELFAAYRKQLRFFIDIKIEGNRVIQGLWSDLPAPVLSLFIDDCIDNAKDYNDGGARYDTTYIQGVGLGTITDSLTSIKYNVFDQEYLTMAELLNALEENYQGREKLRERFINKTPKYGNDDDYADNIMKQVFNTYFCAIDGRPNGRGGTYRVNLLPTTSHIYFGNVCGALPDGRKAHGPLSEGISPVQGVDKNGPTAVFKSVTKMDHNRTGGTLLNQKLSPGLLAGGKEIKKLVHLIRTYFRMGAHHVQFNVVSADLLRDAKKNPEKYQNLIVRVAGYSDYFVNLTEDLQDEIIRRTEHQS